MSVKRDKVLKCPFCDEPITSKPERMQVGYEIFDGGKCKCGAVYVYERSIRRAGEGYMSSLIYAYDGDYDSALNAVEGDREEVVIRYNQTSGQYIHGDGNMLDRSPKFYFVKRNKADIIKDGPA